MNKLLLTAGYTGLKPENLHRAAEIADAYLVDIRISPYSRVPYWMGSHLKVLWGSRYVHVPTLGNINYKNPADGIRLKDPDTGTLRLLELMQTKRVILFCACKDPTTCHRSVAAQEMEDRYNVQVIHLTTRDILNMKNPADLEPPQSQQLELL